MDASEYTPPAAVAYERYADMLYRIAFGVLMSKEDSEDAVADVFAGYIARPPRFRDAEHEKAWFIRVTVNRCRDLQRRRIIRSHAPIDDAGQIAAEDDGQYGLMHEVLKLPEKYREAVILHYFEGFDTEECAAAMGITKSGVKMRLSRARELLKKNCR